MKLLPPREDAESIAAFIDFEDTAAATKAMERGSSFRQRKLSLDYNGKKKSAAEPDQYVRESEPFLIPCSDPVAISTSPSCRLIFETKNSQENFLKLDLFSLSALFERTHTLLRL